MQIFLEEAIFSNLLLKMAATIMTVEFDTNHNYLSLEENVEACLCSSLNRYQKLTEHYVNYVIIPTF